MDNAVIKDHIKQHWSELRTYYDKAESDHWMNRFWGEGSTFRSRFETLDHRELLELACGHGRHCAHVLKSGLYNVERCIAVDINETNIAHCKERFGDDPRVSFLLNNGKDLRDVASQSVTGLFTYDSMVHFEYDDVFSYIAEFYRVLKRGGRALVHHSANTERPGSLWNENPHGRNFMSPDFFAHVAMRRGFRVVDQMVIGWDGHVGLDCITLMEA